jgi:hypothetical protein
MNKHYSANLILRGFIKEKRTGKLPVLYLVVLFFLVNTWNVAGQTTSTLKEVVPPSPTVASLGKYGDIPVSLYTGLPDISVPLYKIEYGELQLPVSLSYHSAGVRVEEVATNVGIGWSLNAGGIVGRNVRGMQDENNYWFPITPANSVEGIMNSSNATLQSQLAEDVDAGYKDGEPDMYYFNFGPYAGKFFFDQSGVAHCTPSRNLIITPYQAGFKIITEDGTVYTFLNYETNNPSNCGNDQFITTAWYLTNIKSKDGRREISFVYEQSVYTYTTLLGQVKYVSVNGSGNNTCLSDQMCVGTQHYVTHRLTRINFGDGYLKFNYNNVRADLVDDKSLDEVEIYTTNNSLLKRYRFYYSYFGNNNDGVNRLTEHTKRLKLDSLQEVTPSITKPPFIFEYNTSVALPDRLSYGQDFWGYYNGKDGNPGLVSKWTNIQNGIPVNYPGADRKANPATSQAAILKKIKYPTGGETFFTYENNTVSDNYAETEMIPINVSLGWSGDANSMPHPYNSQASVTIPPGGAMVQFNVYGLSGLPQGCDMHYCYLMKDGAQYAMIGDNWNNTESFLPEGTYSFRYDYECGWGISVSFSASMTAMFPITTVYPTRVVGGLRIKQIEDKPGSGGPSVVRNYRYHPATDPTKSSGVLVSFPDFGYDLTVHSHDYMNGPTGTGTYNHYCVYKVRQSFSTYPMATTQGSYVGYGHVIEDFGDNGETWHTYNAFADGVSGFPFPPVENREWRRGFEFSTKYYARKNSQLVLVKEITNTPVMFPEFRVYGIKTGRNYLEIKAGQIQRAPYFYANFTYYYISAEFFNIAQTKQKIYDQNDPTKYVEKVIDFTYSPQHLQMVQSTTVTSSKDQTVKDELITNRKYAPDYVFTGAPVGAEAQGIKTLQDLHAVNSIIEEYTVRQKRNTSNNQLSDQRVVASKISLYRTDYPYPDKMLNMEIGSTVPLATFGTGSGLNSNSFIRNPNSTVSNSFKPAVLFETYDDKGNLATQRKTDDIAMSYLWGYDKLYPIAQVSNAAIKDVFYTSFEEGDGNSADGDSKTGKKSKTNGLSIALSNLKNGPYRLTYWSKSGGTWSFQNTPVTISTGTYTINLSGHLDEVRFYPAIAQMTTMTYDPLIGMTSQCDINNRIAYYEYDAFQRLTLIRDQDRNIIRRICYNYYTGQQESCTINTDPNWQSTGTLRCKPCPANSNYLSNIQQREEKDLNTFSATYNQLRWVDIGVSSSCVVNPDWQNTATATRCKTMNGANTGQIEQEQIDLNPCSATYNQLRWIVIATNTTACPIPPSCTPSNCSGPMNKCIQGVCETGIRNNKLSKRITVDGVRMWECTYYYCFSDGSTSVDLTEIRSSPCFISTQCLPW